MIEGGTLLGTEGGEQAVFDQAESDVGRGKRFLPSRGELDDVPSSVGRIALTGDESAFFELVQQPHDVAGIEAQHVTEALLALWPLFAQDPERPEMPGSEATRRGGLGGPTADAGQVIEQRKGLVVHLGS